MKSRHQVSRAAIELIKSFEGYRRKAAQLPDGRWTIGYGHTLTAREGAEVSENDAEALLMYDLITVAHAVNEHSYTPLTQNQFDALCCFAFNVGVDNFRRSSVLRRINEGQLLQARVDADALAGLPPSAYHWYRLAPGRMAWELIAAAAGPTYRLQPGDVAYQVMVVVAVPTDTGSQRSASVPLGPVQAAGAGL